MYAWVGGLIAAYRFCEHCADASRRIATARNSCPTYTKENPWHSPVAVPRISRKERGLALISVHGFALMSVHGFALISVHSFALISVHGFALVSVHGFA